MTGQDAVAPTDLRFHHEDDATTTPGEEPYLEFSHTPHSLRDALRTANGGRTIAPTDSTSEEDYDDQSKKPVMVLMRRRKEPTKDPGQPHPVLKSGSALKAAIMSSEPTTPSDVSSEADKLDDVPVPKGVQLYAVAPNDKELRAILKRGMQRVSEQVTRRLLSKLTADYS